MILKISLITQCILLILLIIYLLVNTLLCYKNFVKTDLKLYCKYFTNMTYFFNYFINYFIFFLCLVIFDPDLNKKYNKLESRSSDLNLNIYDDENDERTTKQYMKTIKTSFHNTLKNFFY